jgi:hypothetical protein
MRYEIGHWSPSGPLPPDDISEDVEMKTEKGEQRTPPTTYRDQKRNGSDHQPRAEVVAQDVTIRPPKFSWIGRSARRKGHDYAKSV